MTNEASEQDPQRAATARDPGQAKEHPYAPSVQDPLLSAWIKANGLVVHLTKTGLFDQLAVFVNPDDSNDACDVGPATSPPLSANGKQPVDGLPASRRVCFSPSAFDEIECVLIAPLPHPCKISPRPCGDQGAHCRPWTPV
jgi:hypothetical protein